MSKLPVTVSAALYDAIAEDCGEGFAASYLSGARDGPSSLTPRTETAYRAIRNKRAAMGVLRSMNLKLIAPLSFGHPDRPDGQTGTSQ